MSLQISTTPAILGINIYKPVQTIEQPRGEQSIQQIPAKMIVDRQLPKVQIDQYQCFAEAGLKNIFDLTKENAQIGFQTAFEYIGRIASEGDSFGRIEDGRSAGEILGNISEQNAWPEREFNIGLIPQSRPKINVTGHLNVQWELGKALIDYRPNRPIHNYQPGRVEYYMRQKNSIQYSYVFDDKV